MKPLKEKVSITLDSDVIEIIRELAEKEDRSFSKYVNIVLKKYVSEYELQNARNEEVNE